MKIVKGLLIALMSFGAMSLTHADVIKLTHGGLKIGTKVVYERNIIDLHMGEGERAIVTYEVLSHDMTTHAFDIKETIAIMGGPTSEKVISMDMHTIVSMNKAAKIVAECEKALLESITTKQGEVLSCRTAKSETSLFFYAAVPFGFSYKVDFDEMAHVAVKFMLLEYSIPN